MSITWHFGFIEVVLFHILARSYAAIFLCKIFGLQIADLAWSGSAKAVKVAYAVVKELVIRRRGGAFCRSGFLGVIAAKALKNAFIFCLPLRRAGYLCSLSRFCLDWPSLDFGGAGLRGQAPIWGSFK